jgi:release factor glutamine methyltransferase
MTIGEALRAAAGTLGTAGIATAELDAELLLRHVLGWDRARLLAASRDPLPEPAGSSFRALVAQRATRRPLQHLTGVQAFWRHDFVVSPDVLIPRPETELLVETALELMRDVSSPIIVDVGTGSGCLAISLALERPDARVVAIDLSAAALAVARANVERLGAGVQLVRGDLLDALRGPVDLVVSNPPYIDPAQRGGLMPEVRDHDPALALFAPEGAPALYARLARQAASVLRPGAALAVEIGAGMAVEVGTQMAAAGLQAGAVHADLQEIARVVIARRG